MKSSFKLLVVGCTIISSMSSLCAQGITLEDCINAFSKDTTFFKSIGIKDGLTELKTYVTLSNFSVSLRSPADSEHLFTKSVNKSSEWNRVIYVFENAAQYEALKKDLQTGGYRVIKTWQPSQSNSNDHILYEKENLSISLGKNYKNDRQTFILILREKPSTRLTF